MPINKSITTKLLEELKDYLSDLESMSFNENDLLENRDIQHLINHRLHTAVEIVIDLATHVASSLELPGRDKASDVIGLLGEHKIIDADLATRMQKAPGLRNILVHGYADIDYRMIYHDYKEEIVDIKEFARQIKNYLENIN